MQVYKNDAGKNASDMREREKRLDRKCVVMSCYPWTTTKKKSKMNLLMTNMRLLHRLTSHVEVHEKLPCAAYIYVLIAPASFGMFRAKVLRTTPYNQYLFPVPPFMG